MKTLKYVGPYRSVEIETAPNLWVEVARNATVDVGDELAKGMLEQADNWKPVKAAKKAPAKKPPAKPESPGDAVADDVG